MLKTLIGIAAFISNENERVKQRRMFLDVVEKVFRILKFGLNKFKILHETLNLYPNKI